MIEFRMPSLGADMEAGTLVDWKVKPGDMVRRGDIIAQVDTQKGLIDIEVFDDGVISELKLRPNEKVPVGTLMALLSSINEAAAKTGIQLPGAVQSSEVAAPVTVAVAQPSRIRVSPLAKKMAEEQGVDLTAIRGTGEEGIVTREDVERAIVAKVSPEEKTTIAGTESIMAAVAAAMSRSNREIPHYYLETAVDMDKALMWMRSENLKRPVNERLLPVTLLLKATAKALAEVRELNGYWEDGFRQKEEINIGLVVQLRTGGIMIPAIRNADKKSVSELMTAINDIIPRVRKKQLRSSELSDTTITVTSLGEGNVETIFGKIYPPQVAIVGFGNITERPWAENGMLGVRPVINITLAADHRATNGATGSRFLMGIKKYLETAELQ